MTSNFEGLDYNQSQEKPNRLESIDRFELLSAYIDGELPAPDKNRVQAWLDEDPQFDRLHRQLLAMQGQIQHSQAPSGEKSTAEITAGVFESIDRQRSQRRSLWVGSAIAASLLAVVSLIPGNSPQLRMADRNNPTEDNSTSVMLAVALNKPAIDIPKKIEGDRVQHTLWEN